MRCQKLSMLSCQLYELSAAKKKKIKFLPQLLSYPSQNLSSSSRLGKCSRKLCGKDHVIIVLWQFHALVDLNRLI